CPPRQATGEVRSRTGEFSLDAGRAGCRKPVVRRQSVPRGVREAHRTRHGSTKRALHAPNPNGCSPTGNPRITVQGTGNTPIGSDGGGAGVFHTPDRFSASSSGRTNRPARAANSSAGSSLRSASRTYVYMSWYCPQQFGRAVVGLSPGGAWGG